MLLTAQSNDQDVYNNSQGMFNVEQKLPK